MYTLSGAARCDKLTYDLALRSTYLIALDTYHAVLFCSYVNLHDRPDARVPPRLGMCRGLYGEKPVLVSLAFLSSPSARPSFSLAVYRDYRSCGSAERRKDHDGAERSSFVRFAAVTFSSRNRRRAFFFFSQRTILESRLEIQAPTLRELCPWKFLG